ncbi:MAG: hypothetical protein AB1938_22885 [Myxococcota bacterium]
MRRTFRHVLATLVVAGSALAEDQVRLPTVLVGEGKAPARYEPVRIVALLSVFNGGLALKGDLDRPLVIALDDGLVLFSQDVVKGGSPYQAVKLEPDAFTALTKRIESYDDDARAALVRSSVGPDSTYTLFYVRAVAGQQVLMRSWHPRDPYAKVVATSRGLVAREGRDPAAVLAADTPEYRRFRQVWAELEGELYRLKTLGPAKATVVSLSWAWTSTR